MRRRDFVGFAAGLAASAAGAAMAGETPPRRRLGYLGLGEVGDWSDILLPAMRELRKNGFVLGENLEFIPRYVGLDPARLGPAARELVSAKVDAILCAGTVATRAVREATRTIPIVTTVADPVGAGFAKSLGTPGGNVTGLSTGQREMYVKIMQMLAQLVPGLRATFLIVPPDYAAINATRYLLEESAHAAGLDFRFVHVSTAADVERALRQPENRQLRGGMVVAAPGIDSDAVLAEMAIKGKVALAKLSAGAEGRDWVKDGGLLAHVTHHRFLAQRLGACVSRVLRGVDPASIPFEVPDESWTWINRATANRLGIRLSSDVALAATEIIE